MGALVKRALPSLIVAAVVAGGVWSQIGLAQPDRPPTTRPPGQPGQPGRPDGRPGGPDGQGFRAPNLGQAMRMLNRGFRDLKGGVGDAAKREENLSAVWMMQQGCAAAKRGKPDHLEGDPAEALEGFRRDQIRLMGMLIEIEAAIMDNKTNLAKDLFNEIHEYEETSHEKYKVEEDEHEGEPNGRPDGGPGGTPADRPPPPSGR